VGCSRELLKKECDFPCILERLSWGSMCTADTATAGVREETAFSACVASSSSSRNSSCSIWRSNFSDLRPNCMRRSLAISSFKCSISLSREVSCASLERSYSVCERSCSCWMKTSVFNAS